MFVRGQGTELWDDQGRRYLDFLCGLAVTSLGHSHPVVAEAIAEQSRTLLHVSNFFANPVATETAIAIDELLGGGGQVFFCNSGAEANEAAFKVARKFGGRGRHVVVSRVRQLPRPDPRRARRHGPADQARAVPTHARGVPPRAVRRPRRARRAPSTRA